MCFSVQNAISCQTNTYIPVFCRLQNSLIFKNYKNYEICLETEPSDVGTHLTWNCIRSTETRPKIT